MNHIISLDLTNAEIESDVVAQYLLDNLECEITSKTLFNVEIYADLETEEIMRVLNTLLEDLIDNSNLGTISICINIQISRDIND